MTWVTATGGQLRWPDQCVCCGERPELTVELTQTRLKVEGVPYCRTCFRHYQKCARTPALIVGLALFIAIVAAVTIGVRLHPGPLVWILIGVGVIIVAAVTWYTAFSIAESIFKRGKCSTGGFAVVHRIEEIPFTTESSLQA